MARSHGKARTDPCGVSIRQLSPSGVVVYRPNGYCAGMRRQANVLAVLAAVLIAISAVVLLVVTRTGLNQPIHVRNSGALVQAVVCARPAAASPCPAAERISTLPSQQAEISGDGTTVAWYSADGTEWQTTVGSSAEVVRVFADNGFTNFRTDSSQGPNACCHSFSPTWFLFLLVPAGVVIAVLIARARQSPRAAPTSEGAPAAERCSFCGALSTGLTLWSPDSGQRFAGRARSGPLRSFVRWRQETSRRSSDTNRSPAPRVMTRTPSPSRGCCPAESDAVPHARARRDRGLSTWPGASRTTVWASAVAVA